MSKESALLFRARKELHDVDEYVKELSAIDIEASCIQALDFGFINLDRLLECLKTPNCFSGIIFTSPRAVEAILRAAADEWQESLRDLWLSLEHFAVGETTAAEAAVILGLTCQGEGTGSAKLLAEFMTKDSLRYTKPFLFPCATLSRETLPAVLAKAGVQIQTIHVYETLAHPDLSSNLSQCIAEKGFPKYVVFFSPSGISHALPLLQANAVPLESTKLVAIGPTTAEALRSAGVVVHCVAAEPNARALVSAIATSLN